MIGGRSNEGFTIVESLIFLAVTGLLFVIAANTISGQQAKTEFAQGTRDFNSQVDSIINEVSDGLFPSYGNFTCRVSPPGAQPVFVATPNSQGTNSDCIFLGKVIAFTSASSQYSVFSVAGTRLDDKGDDVTSFALAKPIAVAGVHANLTVTAKVPFGMKVSTMWSRKGAGSPLPIGAVGFFTSFASKSTTGGINSGSSNVSVVPLRSSSLASINPGDVDNSATGLQAVGDTDINPDSTVICMSQGGPGSRKAAIVIGSFGRQLTTELHIGDVDVIVPQLLGAGYVCP